MWQISSQSNRLNEYDTNEWMNKKCREFDKYVLGPSNTSRPRLTHMLTHIQSIYPVVRDVCVTFKNAFPMIPSASAMNFMA
jgi:hypothetical protein